MDAMQYFYSPECYRNVDQIEFNLFATGCILGRNITSGEFSKLICNRPICPFMCIVFSLQFGHGIPFLFKEPLEKMHSLMKMLMKSMCSNKFPIMSSVSIP